MQIQLVAPQDLADVSALFREYADSLAIDLSYQRFDAELATLPGPYSPPSGALLVARCADGAAIGCVALRQGHSSGVGELKRL